MKRTQKTGKLPAAQQKRVQAVFENTKEIASLKGKLEKAYQKRHALMLRVFDEIEKHPSHYTHLAPGEGGEQQPIPMTREIAGELRARYLKTFKPLTISGPGCDDPPVCNPKPGCICVFGVGTVCCYLCASPAIIQCD
jgi:hypothetical protein